MYNYYKYNNNNNIGILGTLQLLLSKGRRCNAILNSLT